MKKAFFKKHPLWIVAKIKILAIFLLIFTNFLNRFQMSVLCAVLLLYELSRVCLSTVRLIDGFFDIHLGLLIHERIVELKTFDFRQ